MTAGFLAVLDGIGAVALIVEGFVLILWARDLVRLRKEP
jgi:hypothetical protein